MAKKDGKLFVMQFGGVTIAGQTTSSMNTSADMLDATTKDSAGWKEFLPGEKNVTFSVGGLVDPAAAEGSEEALAYIYQGSKLTWKYGETTAGGSYWTGSGYLSAVNITGDKNTLASYTLEVQNTGTPVQYAVIGS